MSFYSIPPLLTLCCFLGLAVITIIRGQRSRVNLLFFLICLLGSFLYIDILIAFNTTSADIALKASRIDHFFLVYLLPVYIHFFHEYLNISHRKWLVRFAYLYAFLLMWITPTPLYIPQMDKYFFGFFARGGPLYLFFGLACFFVTLYVLYLIYHAIQREKVSVQKNKLKFVFAGFGLMGVMNSLNIFPIYGYPVYPIGNLSFIPLIAFWFGIYQHNILDMNLLIKKGLVYSLLTAFLTGLYVVIILFSSKVLKGFAFSDTIYFQMLFFFLIILVLGPLRARVQIFIDDIFGKGKYDYQIVLKDVSQTIASVLDIDDIAAYLTDTVVDIMQVDTLALLLSQSKGASYFCYAARGKHRDTLLPLTFTKTSYLVNRMAEEGKPIIRKKFLAHAPSTESAGILSEMDRLTAEIVLPLIFKNQLYGFVILGEKRSGDLFTPEDMDLLETLASQTALAVENTRAYKKIEDLNKNLESKVIERTRELKAALQEKERTQDQLIQSESLAAIGQLVAGTAHELNNPLASVKSLLQSTIEDLSQWDGKTPPDEDLIDDLLFADKELQRARNIVASLLGLSRQTQQYTEGVNLNTILKDALRVLHNQYKYKELAIIEKYQENIPEIQGNFANLGQVAINIIKNAVQAVSDQSGIITLKTHHDKENGFVSFECNDNGPGIPESLKNDIFKPFFTTKEVGEGTGLGLYICHEIVQRHGGSIMLETTDRNNTCFVVKLPINNEHHRLDS